MVLMQQLDTNNTADIDDKQSIGKNFFDTLGFKYSDIYVKELHSNIIGSLSIPQYVHIHQSNTPVVWTEYIKVQDIDQVYYRSLHMVIKVGKKWIPIIARIIPGVSIPLLIGMNYKEFHAEETDTQRKLNKLNTQKGDSKGTTTNLTVKRPACMHTDMEHADHTQITVYRVFRL